MIEIKGSRDYMVALESVAMTDIVLNMFIFFFISFSLIYTLGRADLSKIEVSLPKAESAVALSGSEKIILAVTEEGEYFINDEKASSGELKREMAGRMQKGGADSVLLKVDGSARFDSVARALDVVNELEIKKIGVAAVKARGE